jgi:hypothetical protein
MTGIYRKKKREGERWAGPGVVLTEMPSLLGCDVAS